MDTKEAFELGRDIAWNLATWVDTPFIGTQLPKTLDWVGVGTIETTEDQITAFEILVGEAEFNARHYSPFEWQTRTE